MELHLLSNQGKREYSFHSVDGHVPFPFLTLHIVTGIFASLTACDAIETKRRESSLPFPSSISSAQIHLIWAKERVNHPRPTVPFLSVHIVFHASLTH